MEEGLPVTCTVSSLSFTASPPSSEYSEETHVGFLSFQYCPQWHFFLSYMCCQTCIFLYFSSLILAFPLTGIPLFLYVFVCPGGKFMFRGTSTKSQVLVLITQYLLNNLMVQTRYQQTCVSFHNSYVCLKLHGT